VRFEFGNLNRDARAQADREGGEKEKTQIYFFKGKPVNGGGDAQQADGNHG
jgi:hypothetical protein